MFIDNILNTILRPFRELYSRWMRIRGIQGGIQGDIRRVKMLGNQVQGYGSQAAGFVGSAPANLQKGLGMGGPQQAQPQQPQAFAQAPPPGKQKMSWFPWGKKTCPGCQNKLRKSWDRCPFCGLAQGGAVPPQGMPPQGMPPQGMPPQGMGQQGMGQGMPPQGMGQGGFPPQGGFQNPQNPMAPPMMMNPGMPQKTIALSVDQINAPMLHAGQDGENVAWLVPLEGPQTGELLQLKGRATIGSADGVTFKIMDAAISSRHAEVTIDGQNRFRVTDLGSTNGTYVNDKKIASIDLVDGDNIRMGRTTFRFKTKH